MDFYRIGIIFVMSNTSFYTLYKLKQWEKVTFYTVLEENDNKQLLWFYHFLEKINEEDKRAIKSLIKKMGTRFGAKEYFFRHEGEAHALPSTKVHFVELHNDLRLYCLRVNEHAVVLFGGGYKDARSAQDSRISYEFYLANTMARKIRKAMKTNEIRLTPDMRLDWDKDLLL